ncbi:uncharacterized protein BDZ99DRAFT_499891 [Mytilinidion resinicola]|uniref:Uncharacterized protein n=1 Tax=Mytilinidion resinicola TaxID=574789 RepID=A0A6A6YJ82_9PEZI|nr:uncharacterized protein BDZ99DRAFT_499891 [Mytilinidion resinicola]KAF2808629.1 hypothetical protein BDZ99DRAFT_499891 [Mytilinidion resinicola]
MPAGIPPNPRSAFTSSSNSARKDDENDSDDIEGDEPEQYIASLATRSSGNNASAGVYDDELPTPVGTLCPLSLEQLKELADSGYEFVIELQKGQYDFIRKAYGRVKATPDGDIQNDDWNIGFESCVTLTCSIAKSLLLEIMGGNLARPHPSRAQGVKQALEANREHSTYDVPAHPSIFARYLTDDTGLSPTPREQVRAVHYLHIYADQYPESYALAYDIDNVMSTEKRTWTKEECEKGSRRYLNADNASIISEAK